jgi:UDP-glucose 4-epimerase
MTKILITGGCGFIGANLTEFLLEKTDWKINILDNLSNSSIEDLKKIKNYSEKRIEFTKGDIKNQKDIEKTMKDCKFVINLAAQTSVINSIKEPIKDAEENIIAVIKLLQQAKKEKAEKFIHASSAAAIGEQEIPINEKKIPEPLCPYGASKLSGEAYCSSFANSDGINTIALRFSNVYGPISEEKGSVIPKFIKKIKKEETITVYGDGEQTRDFVYVKDICNGIYLSLIKKLPKKFELIQLGTGKETSINKLIEILKKKIKNKKINIKYSPARSGEIIRNYTDIKKAKDLLNYTPEFDIEKGIEETISSFEKN